MSATRLVLELVGEVVLLLWGMRMVHSGIVRAYGSTLRRVLGSGLRNRFAALGAGIVVTAILQSSTATALMTASFAAEGVVELVPALAIMLGASIGTTLVVKLLAFDIAWAGPVLLMLGYVAFKRARKSRPHHLARVGIGLGLMLLALHQLVQAIRPAEGAPVLHDLLALATGDPVLDMAIAALLTCAAHSSVAVMLLIVALANAQLLSPVAALALVLGANLGATVPPLLAAAGPHPAARRLPLGNLALRAAGCAAALPFLAPLAERLQLVAPDIATQAVDFHIGFNLALAAVFIGGLTPLARLLEHLLPAAPATDPVQPQFLDETAVDTPYLALANAARETWRMADIVEAMLRGTLHALLTNDRHSVSEVCRLGTALDGLHEAVKRYLTRIGPDALAPDDSRRHRAVMAFAVGLGQAGDVVEHSLAGIALRKAKRHLTFAPDDEAEIREIHGMVLNDLRLALSVFMSEDPRSAGDLLAAKRHLNDRGRDAKQSHLARLGRGLPGLETSTLHLAVLRDLQRVNSLIAAIAYPVLDAADPQGPAGRPQAA